MPEDVEVKKANVIPMYKERNQQQLKGNLPLVISILSQLVAHCI